MPTEPTENSQDLTALVDKFDVTLPDAGLPDLNFNNNHSISLPGLNNPLSDQQLLSMPDANLPELNGITEQVSQYENQITEIIPRNSDDVAAIAEKEVSDLSNMGEVQKQIGDVGQLKEMAGNLQSEEAVKEKAEIRSKETSCKPLCRQRRTIAKSNGPNVEVQKEVRERSKSFRTAKEKP